MSRNFSSPDEELIDFGSVFVYWRYGSVTDMTVGGKDDMPGSSKNHSHLSHQMKMVRNAERVGHVQKFGVAFFGWGDSLGNALRCY